MFQRYFIFALIFFLTPPVLAVEAWMTIDSAGVATQRVSNGGIFGTPTTMTYKQMDPGLNSTTIYSGRRQLYTPDTDKYAQLVGAVTGLVMEMPVRLSQVFLKVSNNGVNNLIYDTSMQECAGRGTNPGGSGFGYHIYTWNPINIYSWSEPHHCSTGRLASPVDNYNIWDVTEVRISFNPQPPESPMASGWVSYLKEMLKTYPKDTYRGTVTFPVCQLMEDGTTWCKDIHLIVNVEIKVELTSAQLSQDEVKFNVTHDPVSQKVHGVGSVYVMLAGQFGRALTVEVKSGSTQGKLTNAQAKSEIPYTMDATLTRTGIKERLLDGRTGLRNKAEFNWINGNTAQVQFDFAFEQDGNSTPAGSYTDNMVIMFGTEI